MCFHTLWCSSLLISLVVVTCLLFGAVGVSFWYFFDDIPKYIIGFAKFTKILRSNFTAKCVQNKASFQTVGILLQWDIYYSCNCEGSAVWLSCPSWDIVVNVKKISDHLLSSSLRNITENVLNLLFLDLCTCACDIKVFQTFY